MYRAMAKRALFCSGYSVERQVINQAVSGDQQIYQLSIASQDAASSIQHKPSIEALQDLSSFSRGQRTTLQGHIRYFLRHFLQKMFWQAFKYMFTDFMIFICIHCLEINEFCASTRATQNSITVSSKNTLFMIFLSF